MNFITHTTKLLKKDKRLWSEDSEPKLLKSTLISLITEDDETLLTLLASDQKIKDQFFKSIDKTLIFRKEKFVQFVTMDEFLPDSFTAFKNKIGLSTNGKLLSTQDDVSLVFPYKDCILEGGQDKEDVKRDEIFYNTTLAPDEIDRLKEPKVLTNWKRYDKDGEHKVSEISEQDNFIIKGNNLLALYSLLPKYRGKVKLIYIDPPYNTGNDGFKYNDSFNHSSWLVFMKNRLGVAKQLLSDEGNIFIQIDDNEQAYLKVLCDDIFGRENFRAQINWLRSSSGKTISRNLPSDIDYILWYSKTDQYVFNPVFKPLSESTVAMYNKDDKDGRGKYRLFPLQKTGGPGPETTYDYIDNQGKKWLCPLKGWRMVIKKLKALENDGRLYLEGKTIAEKAYWNERDNEGKIANNLWDDIYNLQGSNNEKVEFAGQKPEKLLKRIIEMASMQGDIVLDYHAGTGTTLAVAHKMKRQYIGVEQMDYIHDLPEARLKRVIDGDQSGISKDVKWQGGGSFMYMELAKWNRKFMDELEKAKSKADIKKIKANIEKEAFLRYAYEQQNFDNTEFDTLSEKDQKQALMDMLDMNHLYVNKGSISDATFKVSEEDRKMNAQFYNTK